MTNRLIKAAKALGISVHDHIVVGHRKHASSNR
ncbi:MAG: hypothetical protein KJN99_00400 [Marinicaulis sp.]|nr:hypothetical protein [Marinicaulis sp.]